jgi:hypothetical protein
LTYRGGRRVGVDLHRDHCFREVYFGILTVKEVRDANLAALGDNPKLLLEPGASIAAW